MPAALTEELRHSPTEARHLYHSSLFCLHRIQHMKEKNMREECENPVARRRKNLVFGLMLIAAGMYFMANDWIVITELRWWHWASGAIALSGFIELISAQNAAHVGRSVCTLVIAAWLYISAEHLWGWNFSNSWPLLLIGAGAQYLIGGMFSSDKK